MSRFLVRNKYPLTLLFVFLLFEVLVNPLGDFPLNDDWSYAKSVAGLHYEGRFDIGAWPAMTLATHLYWGLIFTKIFGFSFFVLRLSTFISSIIGLFILYKLTFRITLNTKTAFVAALCLLVSPLYFNLSNTYMTDVNFNTLLLLSSYFIFDFFETRSKVSFALVFVFSLLTILLRQFGIIIPLCFVASCFFLKERKWNYVMASVVLTGFVYLLFKQYEVFLQSRLDSNSQYKFSGGLSLSDPEFLKAFLYKFKTRYAVILYHIFFYTFPFLLFFSKSILRTFKIVTVMIVAGLSFALVYYVFQDVKPQTGNVFMGLNLGAETFYEYLSWPMSEYRNASGTIETLFHILKYVFISGSCTLIILALFHKFKSGSNRFFFKPIVIFLFCLMFSYALMLIISDSFFDRYHIPLITVMIILYLYLVGNISPNVMLGLPLIVVSIYVSVAGTKDYFTVHRTTKDAYYYLKNEEGIPASKINACIEINYWNEGRKIDWYNFLELQNFDYLIQYKPADHFKTVKTFEFKRYLPPGKDSIRIFQRQAADRK